MANYFLNRYTEITGDSASDLKDYTIKPCLRVNTIKISSNELSKRLKAKGVSLTKVPFLDDAFYYESKFSLASTEEYLLGYFYIQDAASQLPPIALAKNMSGTTTLDMAAAPGSKTTQLASLMNNKGKLIAIDTNANRIKALTNNLERCGVKNTFVYQKDGQYVKDFNMKFDGILLDVPCSGNFAIEKNWVNKRQPSDIKTKSKTQVKLLKSGLSVLKEGGVLVYSTCSLEPEENEQVLDSVLDSKYKIIPSKISVGDAGLNEFKDKKFRPDMKNSRRLWPHKHSTQGFFLAAIKKL